MEVSFNSVVILPTPSGINIQQSNICTATIEYKNSSACGQICGRVTKCGNRCGYHKHK